VHLQKLLEIDDIEFKMAPVAGYTDMKIEIERASKDVSARVAWRWEAAVGTHNGLSFSRRRAPSFSSSAAPPPT
jgi:hypothetical protein